LSKGGIKLIEKVVKAKSVDQALGILMEYGKGAKLIAGGTDVIIQLRHKSLTPKVLIDISSVEELKYIEEKDGFIEIGAATTFKEIQYHPYFSENMKGISKAASMVGSPQIRSSATIGGNICNGSPAADIVPPLLALDAVATIKCRRGTREINLEKFFVGKGKVDIDPYEMLTSVKFKALEKDSLLSFSKLGLRKALAISRICTSVMLQLDEDHTCKNIKIANGSLGEYGVREKEVEKFYINNKINEETISEGLELLRKSIDDRLHGRSSLPYKIEAVEGTFREAMKSAMK
jgi:carbon-monoxide dehydrogenase medium subunit/xanthine dehydrogenase FAD-binding subunit